MTDVHTQEIRSYNMSRIKGKDTKPEILVRKFLFGHGFRYRLHDKQKPGKPDLVLTRHKTIIFIHGCFWHGHKNCRYFSIPKTRTEWWSNKIGRNRGRDKDATILLIKEGWRVITIWECDLRPDKIEHTLSLLLKKFRND
nr:very short patch repair endonuclease [uncultured Sediminibacterium sp.]